MKGTFALALIGIGLAGSACTTQPGDKEFLVPVDSVTFPSAVSGNAPFAVTFYGLVGNTGCFEFKEFRVRGRKPGSIFVEPVAVHHISTGTCPDVVIRLDGAKLRIDPPTTDPFRLDINQPRATVLEKVI